MSQIQEFADISDYIKAADLGIDSKYPDFLIYDYGKANPDACVYLQTFRQNYYEITLETSDGCNTMVDQFEHPTTESRIVLVSPHRLQTFRTEPETGESYKAYGIFFKPEFMGVDSANGNFLQNFPFFSHLNTPFISLEQSEADLFSELIERIQHEYDSKSTESREVIKNYLNILFLKAKQRYPDPVSSQANGANGANGVSREREIYDTFKQLVQNHFSEIKSVRGYADRLHITPKHLSETVKRVSGKSALEEIHQVKLIHAKALLRQTSRSVAEIAHELNFDNPEYFSVFFKRLTGESPSQFRDLEVSE